jgi:hypothetical protein
MTRLLVYPAAGLVARPNRPDPGPPEGESVMSKIKTIASAGVLLAFVSTIAAAQAPTRVRGEITGFDGKVLSVKTREGKDVKINVPDNVGVSAVKKITIDDIKPGDFVGPASRKRPDGTLEAISLQKFPDALRGVVSTGHTAWDLEPGSVMTNANIANVVQTNNGKELTLEYKGGSQKVVVPANIPMFTTEPGDKSLLKKGAHIFTAARPGPDGNLSTARITVEKDGVRPAN